MTDIKNKTDHSLDPAQLITFLLQRKKQYTILTLAALIIGGIIAFSIPKTYTTRVKLAPEAENENLINEKLGGLASMLGSSFGKMGKDAISPAIYPDVLSSTKFIVELFDVPVKTINGKQHTTLFNYCTQDMKAPWWLFPFAQKAVTPPKSYFRMNKEQWKVANTVSDMVRCDVDINTDVLTIQVTTQDPLVSATLANAICQRLQQFMTEYRTSKAQQDLDYAKKLYREAKEKYEKARRLYAAYSDANEGLVLQSFISKREDLENDMQLKYNAYTQMFAQMNAAQMKLQEKTPVYAVLQPAVVPEKKSGPKRVLIIMATLMATLFVYTTLGLTKLLLQKATPQE